MEGPGTSGSGKIEFTVKRPSLENVKDLKLKLPDSATLSEVKAELTELYDDHPHPATITVIEWDLSCHASISMNIEQGNHNFL